MSQPHFEGSVRSSLTLPKMGLGSPSGLPKIQSTIARVKTPCIEMFFTLLESSQRELQLCFRPCPNLSLGREVMNTQSLGSPNRDSFETPFWESREKVQFRCKCGGETQKILYGGRWWLPPSSSHGESSESKVARD
jgi:hypothetical protein